MPDQRRLPLGLLAAALAVPIFAAVYLSVAGRRAWLALRPVVAFTLGATVIGSVYADEAARRGPAAARRGLELLPTPRISPARTAAVLAVAIVLAAAGNAPAPVAAASSSSKAGAVVAAARSHLGKPFRMGGTGPRLFDCSGLVYRIFKETGQVERVGGRRLGATGYLRWFASRGMVSKVHADPGDLVVYGGGAHMGVYLGNNKVLSAITSGVSIHPLKGWLNVKFTTFLNVGWKGGGSPGGGGGGGGGGVAPPPGGGGGGGPAGGGGVGSTTLAPKAKVKARSVVKAAKAYLGKPFGLHADGPDKFSDASLVYQAFADAGQLPRITERRRTAASYLRWFTKRGLVSKVDGRKGDLVIYGNGRHIGIYLGHGRVLSALVTGVSKHPLNGLDVKFTGFLRVDWKAPLAPTQPTMPTLPDTPIAKGITTAALNLRAAPGTSEKIIAVLANGTKVKVFDNVKVRGAGRWLQVTTRTGQSGWISAAYAEPRDSAADGWAVPTAPSAPTMPDKPVAKGTTSAPLNLRNGPGTAEKVLRVLPTGTKVKVFDTVKIKGNGRWLQVTTRTGRTGWISAMYAEPRNGTVDSWKALATN